MIYAIVSLLLIVMVLMIFIMRYRKRISEMEYPYEMEERLLELLGKFKHVASIKLEMLEKKIEELKKLIREANDIYASLTVVITDASKFKSELIDSINEKNEGRETGNVEQTERMREDVDVEEEERVKEGEEGGKGKEMEETEETEETVEKKIMRLNEEGLSDTEIARELGIGVSEVKLVIDLFKRRGGK